MQATSLHLQWSMAVMLKLVWQDYFFLERNWFIFPNFSCFNLESSTLVISNYFVENHWKSKEKVFPLHTDPNMPYEHFMKVKWSWEVVKSGFYGPRTMINQFVHWALAKYGLLNWYSRLAHSRHFYNEFIDYCEDSTNYLVSKMDSQGNFSHFYHF